MIGYGRVDRSTWDDEKFVELTPLPPSGQSLWLFLLSCPAATPLPGLIRGGPAGLAEILRWSQADFGLCWHEIESRGMAVADWRTRTVWLPNAPKRQPVYSPNEAKAWAKQVKGVVSPLRSRIAEDVLSGLRRPEISPSVAAAFEAELGNQLEELTPPPDTDSFQRGRRASIGATEAPSEAPPRSPGEAPSGSLPLPLAEPVAQGLPDALPEPGAGTGAGTGEGRARGRATPTPALEPFPLPGPGDKVWNVPPKLLAELELRFPRVNVRAELGVAVRKIRCQGTHRRTARQLPGFLHSWMKHVEEDLPAAPPAPAPAEPPTAWEQLGGSRAAPAQGPWARIRQQLCESLSIEDFETWIAPLLVGEEDGDTIYLVAPNRRFVFTIRERFAAALDAAAVAVLGEEGRIQVDVDARPARGAA